MKNLFFLMALTGCFMFLNSSTATAQNINNNTDCDFKVTVVYGGPLSCRGNGTITVTVPANGVVNLDLPPGNSLISASGGYTVPVASANCNFVVGKSSCGLSPDASRRCTGGCGAYRVAFDLSSITISN